MSVKVESFTSELNSDRETLLMQYMMEGFGKTSVVCWLKNRSSSAWSLETLIPSADMTKGFMSCSQPVRDNVSFHCWGTVMSAISPEVGCSSQQKKDLKACDKVFGQKDERKMFLKIQRPRPYSRGQYLPKIWLIWRVWWSCCPYLMLWSSSCFTGIYWNAHSYLNARHF